MSGRAATLVRAAVALVCSSGKGGVGILKVSFARDGHVVVRVTGTGSLFPVAGTRRRPIRSMAIANSVFFDVDGNGRFDAPKAPSSRTRSPRAQ